MSRRSKADREHLVHLGPEDFIRQTFRVGGKGGQNVNKVETGVRYIHEPSGVVAEGREHRTQGQNDKAAKERLLNDEQFIKWLKWESYKEMRRLDGLKTLEAEVDELMKPENLKIEIKVNGKWAEITWDEIQALEREFSK